MHQVITKSWFVILFFAATSCSNAPENDSRNITKVDSLPAMPLKEVTPLNPFAGSWEWEKSDSVNTFHINIIQRGDSLFGEYCAVVRNGARVDCSTSEDKQFEENFRTVLPQGDTFETEFTSYYSGNKGKVLLTMKENKLIWKMTTPPTESFAPREAILNKQ